MTAEQSRDAAERLRLAGQEAVRMYSAASGYVCEVSHGNDTVSLATEADVDNFLLSIKVWKASQE